MKINSPCFGCVKRCLLCHAHCKEYAEYQQKLKERAKRSKTEIEADTFAIKRSERIKRARQQRFDDMQRNRGR